jgi:chemotaxis protein MotB
MILYSMSNMDEKKFYELGKSIASNFKQVDQNNRNQVLAEMVDGKRQLRAFQMLVAILNLGEESEAIEKIEETYSKKVEAEAAGRVIEQGIRKLPSAKKLRTTPTEKGVLAEMVLPVRTTFKSGTDQLHPKSKARMRRFAAMLRRVEKFANIEVVGHTDSSPPSANSKYADNWELSSARAATVARALTENGLSGNNLSVKGRASFEPLFPEYNKQGQPIAKNKARNRRVAIRVVQKNE